MVKVVKEPQDGEAVMNAQAAPATEAATEKIQSRVTNWPEYDRALVRRGSLTIGFDKVFLQDYWRPAPTGQRGGPFQSRIPPFKRC